MRAAHLAPADLIRTENVAIALALDHAARNVAAADHATGAYHHATTLHLIAGVVAVGPAERATGNAVVAGDVAVTATIGRAVVYVVAVKVAVVAADATAVDHIVAGEPATVAAGAALVAIGSAAAIARVAAGAASLARLASGKNSGDYSKTNSEDELHGQPEVITSRAHRARELARCRRAHSPGPDPGGRPCDTWALGRWPW